MIAPVDSASIAQPVLDDDGNLLALSPPSAGPIPRPAPKSRPKHRSRQHAGAEIASTSPAQPTSESFDLLLFGPATAAAQPPPDNMDLLKELGLPELVELANAGDPAALEELRKGLDRNPHIWQHVGDLAVHAHTAMIRKIAEKDRFVHECIVRNINAKFLQLVGPNPSPLVRLAAQRVIGAWLEMNYVDAAHPIPDTENLRLAKFILALKRSAQRSYDSALKALAAVKTMEARQEQAVAAKQASEQRAADRHHVALEATAAKKPEPAPKRPKKKSKRQGSAQDVRVPANRLQRYLASDEPVSVN